MINMRKFFNKGTEEEHDFWMSYTDLMAGFLIVFIITSLIVYSNYRSHQEMTASDLKNMIHEYKTILVSNNEVNVQFDTKRGSIILTHMDSRKDLFQFGAPQMQPELERFIQAHGKKMIQKTISLWKQHGFSNIEMRIEGHTDPVWSGERGTDYGYIRNLELSSDRANSVYTYMLNNLDLTTEEKAFVKKNMISIGYSYSRRLSNGNINDTSLDPSSRRIEFRIISK